MRRNINRSREARIDVIESAYFIAETNLNAVDRFLQATETAYEALAEMPGMGALRDYNNPRYAGMRMWPVPGFTKHLIFYQIRDVEIEILRVLHGAQDLAKIFAPEAEE